MYGRSEGLQLDRENPEQPTAQVAEGAGTEVPPKPYPPGNLGSVALPGGLTMGVRHQGLFSEKQAKMELRWRQLFFTWSQKGFE